MIKKGVVLAQRPVDNAADKNIGFLTPQRCSLLPSKDSKEQEAMGKGQGVKDIKLSVLEFKPHVLRAMFSLFPLSLSVPFLFLALSILLFIPHRLYAQLQGLPTAYMESITEDEEGGPISFPSFLFVEPVRNEIYVIDGKSRIILFTSDFFPLFTLSRRNGVESPQGLTVNTDGNLYLAQSATKENPRHRISVFNARLIWDHDIYIEGFEGADTFAPYSLAIDKNGNMYVSGSFYPGVLILNSTGKFTGILSPEEEGKQVKVNYVTLDQMGRIYLVSEEDGHVYVYDEDRKFLFRFGEKGGSTGKLSRPRAIGIDNRNGRMYVIDYMRHTVLAYDKEGKYLFEFGGLGWGEGWFQYPRDIAVDLTGRIFVADTFNDRIQIFQPKENQ